MKHLSVPEDYVRWLSSLKSRIQGARARAVLAANEELVRLYHQIGTEILERQKRQGWGARVIDRLASDLREAFPEMKGLVATAMLPLGYPAETAHPSRLHTDRMPLDEMVIRL